MYFLKQKMVHFQMISKRVDVKMYLRLTRSSARRARSPRALQLAGPQSGGEMSSESVALGPGRGGGPGDGGGWRMAGGWSSRQHPSSDSTYLQVFPGSLVGGEKRPPKTPTSLSDTRKPVSLHVSPIQGHTGETQNQRGRPCPFAPPQIQGREAGSVKRQNREPFRPSPLVAPRWGYLLVMSWIYVFV